MESGDWPAAARDTIGRYVLLERLGRGGMGTVVRAYDPKLQREVALKRLGPQRVGDPAEERLVAEARAMARLNHPNVVAVYDVEVQDDAWVLAMEYVPGRSLAQWLQTPRPWASIVAKFRRAGAGLAAAHRAGIVHRDFKPSNVLVGEAGVVKVADFGLAEVPQLVSSHGDRGASEDPSSSDVDVQRTRRDRVVGTPHYMAPEQLDADDAAPTVDQYAFCVALWEALVGAPVVDADSVAALLAAKRAPPPPWPTSSKAPRYVGEAVRRGLAPAPADRHASMEALLEALAPRRSRARLLLGVGTVATAAVVAVYAQRVSAADPCMDAGRELAEIWNEDVRAGVVEAARTIAAPHAENTAERVVDRIDAWAGTWQRARIEACRIEQTNTPEATAVASMRAACLRRAKARLAATVDVLSEPDTQTLDRAPELVGSLPIVERCLDASTLEAEGLPADEPEMASALVSAYDRVTTAATLRDAGRLEEAMAMVVEIEPAARSLDTLHLRAELSLLTGTIHEQLGARDEAEVALQAAQALALETRSASLASEVTSALARVTGYDPARVVEARDQIDVALALARAVEPGGRLEADAHRTLGSILMHDYQWAEAAAEYEQAVASYEAELGDAHPSTVLARGQLAGALAYAGRAAQAEAEHAKALAVVERTSGPTHPNVFVLRANIADDLQLQGRLAEAADEYQALIEVRTPVLGATHPTIGRWHYNLGNILQAAHRYEEAEAAQGKAIEILTEALGAEHLDVASARNNRANVLWALGRLEEAEAEHRASLAVREASLGPDNPRLAIAHYNIGNVLLDRERPTEARAEFEICQAIMRRAKGDGDPDTARCLAGVATAAWRQQRPEEATRLWEAALQTLEGSAMHGGLRGQVRLDLARVAWEQGDRAQARAQAARARAEFVALAEEGTSAVAEVDAWLTAHGGGE